MKHQLRHFVPHHHKYFFQSLGATSAFVFTEIEPSTTTERYFPNAHLRLINAMLLFAGFSIRGLGGEFRDGYRRDDVLNCSVESIGISVDMLFR